MTQCDSILFDSNGKMIEQCQLGNMHDGEHRYSLDHLLTDDERKDLIKEGGFYYNMLESSKK